MDIGGNDIGSCEETIASGASRKQRFFRRLTRRNASYSSDDDRFRHKEPVFQMIKHIYTSLRKGIDDVSIKSDVAHDYYTEITSPNTKSRARLFVKAIMMFCVQTLLVIASVPKSEDGIIMLTAAVLCVGCNMFYGSSTRTFKDRYHQDKCYSILLGGIMVLVILIQSPKAQNIIKDITPIPQTIILIYAVYLIDFELTAFICIQLSGLTFYYETIQLISIRSINYTHSSPTTLALFGASMKSEEFYVSTSSLFLRREFYGFLLMWIILNATGCYLYAMSRLRQLSAFRQLGQNIEIRERISAQKEETMLWISAVMPSAIIPEYMKFVKDAEKEKSHGKNAAESSKLMSVFSRSYSEVSILFADIVGFTNMSSNKTATEVVMLLNDLFNRFDKLCKECGCEKLGTLGDCYYCVAGCPKPRRDHAVCCVRMGLGMCVIIQSFNRQYNENVNMRVGVHSGRVNAAVIGKFRFRYDVYSYAVIIANEMESSGIPGKVHISAATHERIKHCFSVEPGEDLEIKTEKEMGMQGMMMTTEVMKTYFVVDRRGHTKISFETQDQSESKSDKRMKEQAPLNIVTLGEPNKVSDASEASDESVEQDNPKITKSNTQTQYDEEALIRAMKEDPEHQADLFKLPPLHPITLNFISDDVERAFRDQMFSDEGSLTIESSRLAPFLDCFTSTIYVITYTIVSYCLCYRCGDDEGRQKWYSVRLGISATQVIACIILTTPLLLDMFRKSAVFQFYRTFTMRNVRSLIFCSMPMITMLSYFECVDSYGKRKEFYTTYTKLGVFSILSSLLLVSGSSWVNIAATFLKLMIMLLVYNQHYFCRWLKYSHLEELNITSAHTLCEIMTIRKQRDIGLDFDMIDFQTTILVTSLVVAFLVRGNDFNLRLCFFATYEADRKRRDAEDASQQTENLLYNIVPKYVMTQLLERGATLTNASYAISVPNAGVTFACISNFFSTYYREDYKGGESALALLNKIICMFDDTMKNYKHVEKIKTINDCYMVASGLNVKEVDQNIDHNTHLYSLMNYCFHLLDIIQYFNETWIIGEEKFTLKVGYNIGPVTAGIIGTTKPMYDMWGDTVNVSSRMYSTSKPGVIQCPKTVRVKLKSKYKFKRRGYITVKGKGKMKVYLCIGRKRRM